tara:strand:- start:330 stop:593 length:264 start_codon:yes stop_codon:yes gene_type:complete
MIKVLAIGLVAGNLLVLNGVAFLGYRALNGGLDLLKTELALQFEERLTEEYKYITKDLESLKGNLLGSQEKLIPSPAKVQTGLPILP